MRKWGVRAIHVKVGAAVGLAAVLGMASLAAAAPDTPAPSEETVEPAPDPVAVDPVPADPQPEVGDEPDVAPDPAVPDEADTEAPPAETPGTCLTHGQRVSAIAHSTPPGPGHGAAVSAAAHDHTGECAHRDDETEDPADDAGDEPPPAVSPVLPSSPALDDHAQKKHETQGAPGLAKAHGNKKG